MLDQGIQPRPTTLEVSKNFDDIFSDAGTTPIEATTTATELPITTIDDFIVPIVAEEVIVEQEAPKPTTTDNKYKERIKLLIEDGLIEDFGVGITKEDGERVEIPLSELEDIDKDLYKTLLDTYKSTKDKEKNDKFISVEGLDDTTRKIIEVKKAGGNLTEAIQPNIEALDQIIAIKSRLENSDPNEQIQVAINIVAQDLQNKGLSERVIQAQIKDYVENLEIDTIANQILDSHLSIHKQEIDNKHKEELQRIEGEKEQQKQFRQSLSAKYKEWELPEALKKVLVDNATKVDENNITNTDKLYFDAIKDPEKFAKINYMLNNLESFENFISHKKVMKAKTNNLSTIIDINLNSIKKAKTNPDSMDERYSDALNNN